MSCEKDNDVAVITTSYGDMVIEFYPDVAPMHVESFITLAKEGYFDGTTFHRVIPGFVIQGGGLTTGMQDKQGNPPIENEANNGLKNEKWTLSMARTSDRHSATSQFFIN